MRGYPWSWAMAFYIPAVRPVAAPFRAFIAASALGEFTIAFSSPRQDRFGGGGDQR